MSYIDRNLLPSENILFRTRKTKMIFTIPVLLTIFSVYATNYMSMNPILVKVIFAPWAVTGLYWSYKLLDYFTSEYAVTDKRIMMREGFFTRHANEMRITAISQVNVDQNLVGQILNFGTVSINAFGAFDSYPMISRPFQFQRAVNQQLDVLLTNR